MDTVTQGVLGAACGQAFFARRLGRGALVWGAVGGLLPDLDMAVIPLFGPLAEFQYHRSLTHSLFFAPVVGPLLGWLLWQRARRRQPADPGRLRDWAALLVVALVTHPLLDWFTTYGTLLLWPFSWHRFALDGVAIVDPLYTLPLALPLVLFRRHPGRAQRAARMALAATTAFLFYGVWLNVRAEDEASRQLATLGPRPRPWQSEAYPTLLQPWLRRIVARSESEVQVGLLSLFGAPSRIAWRGFREASDPPIAAARRHPDGALFEWFASGQTTGRAAPCAAGRCLELEDLRYGYGGAPDQGLWGVRFPVGPDGLPDQGAERFNRRPPPVGDVVRLLWRETFTRP